MPYIYILIYAPASLLPLPPLGMVMVCPPPRPVDLWWVWIGVNAGVDGVVVFPTGVDLHGICKEFDYVRE